MIGVTYIITSLAQSDSTLISPTIPQPTVTLPPSTVISSEEKKGIFVPYWSLPTKVLPSTFDEYYYFGITADKDGIDYQDQGYIRLSRFTPIVPPQGKALLTMRLINSDFNSQLLKDKQLQNHIIDESVELAKKNNFKGIVLDFEFSALSFDSVIKLVSDFYKKYSKAVHSNNLTFYSALYGDVFFRLRPYNVSEIGIVSDKLLVMTYDFHKARGNPGPNFPLEGKEKYGYDYAQLIKDYTTAVPANKLIFVFGMFGYDWQVDREKNSIRNGEALSLLEIQKKFYPTCTFTMCSIERDQQSAETTIFYKDYDNTDHIVWFEDEISMQKKRRLLEKYALRSYALWAYSYSTL